MAGKSATRLPHGTFFMYRYRSDSPYSQRRFELGIVLNALAVRQTMGDKMNRIEGNACMLLTGPHLGYVFSCTSQLDKLCSGANIVDGRDSMIHVLRSDTPKLALNRDYLLGEITSKIAKKFIFVERQTQSIQPREYYRIKGFSEFEEARESLVVQVPPGNLKGRSVLTFLSFYTGSIPRHISRKPLSSMRAFASFKKIIPLTETITTG